MKNITDLEKFIKLYKSFGIDCIVNENQNEFLICFGIDSTDLKSHLLDTKVTTSPSFNGYGSSYCFVRFCKDGSFKSQEWWD